MCLFSLVTIVCNASHMGSSTAHPQWMFLQAQAIWISRTMSCPQNLSRMACLLSSKAMAMGFILSLQNYIGPNPTNSV